MRPRTLAVVLCLVLSLVPVVSVAGGPITSGSTVAGSLTNPTYLESWTFSGVLNHRVIVSAVTTSGAVNTQITIKKPGGVVEASTSADRFDVQLTASGTYTIEITDVGLNDAGSYALYFVDVTGGPYTDGVDLDGGPFVSAEVGAGTISGAADIDVFTFAGTNGDRVLMNAVATGGVGFNTTIYLYPPDGAGYLMVTGGDRLDAQLTATGTWAMTVEDNGNDTAGSYSLSIINITAGPTATAGDTDGGLIVSNEIKTGEFQQGQDFDVFTFNAVVGQRVILVSLATGGGTHNPQLSVYPPNGGPTEGSSAADRWDVQVAQTGTYSLVVEDSGNDATGTYLIALTNVTGGPHTDGSDPDGGPIVSAEVKTGTMSGPGDIDVFTFFGTNGDRVLMNAVATGGVGFNTTIYLYPPNGAGYLMVTGGDRLDAQLTATGTWAMTVEDNGNDTAGSYSMSVVNVTAGPTTTAGDTDGGLIVSNEIKTGEFQQGQDFDVFTFSGVTGQRVILVSLATGGGVHNPQLSVYPPNGGSTEGSSAADRWDVQLAQTGTYSILVEDSGNDATGTYLIALTNVTGGPHTDGVDPDGGSIVSAEVKTGTMSGPGDIDVFTFTGTNGDRVLVDAVATGGVGFNTTIYLYPPNGAGYLIVTGGDRLDAQLTATGTWAMTVEDNGNDTAGSYSMSLMNITAGPRSNGADTDGGTIVSNQIKTGQFQQGVDFDAFTFTTTAADQRIVLVSLATGAGSHNPQLSVYPPAGAPTIGSSAADRWDLKTGAAGTYVLVVEDAGNDHAGTYTVALMNVNGGPLTSGGDTGGSINSDEVMSGSMNGPADIDAYQFLGSAGSRVAVSAVATGGVGFNTVIYLYPPNGAGYLTVTGGDRLDAQLTASGYWTVLVEDNGSDTAGDYTMSVLNITAGPYTHGGDANGGPIADNTPVNGSSAVADFDGYTFFGIGGQMLTVSCIVTAGAMNTQTTIYPPFGAPTIFSTAADNFNVALAVNGVYTVVVEDAGQDQTGDYQLTINATPTGIGDSPSFKVVSLLPAAPSPFSHTTRMGFRLPAAGHVRLRIYDVTGARVRSLVDDARGAGAHWAEWDGRDDRGNRVASGVYYTTLEAAGEVKRQKVVLVR